MGVCPWALRMTPGCLWKLWKCGATISVTSLCSPSDDSGAELHAIHLWWSFWYSLQNLISAFSLFKQEFKYLFAQLRSLSHYSNIQPLEGWCHGSGAWLYQAIIDVCTWTGTQLLRSQHLFHFPRWGLKVPPEQCHICLQGYCNTNGSLSRREKGPSQKRKKVTSKWREATNFWQELEKHLRKINASSYMNSWSQQPAIIFLKYTLEESFLFKGNN